MKFISVCIALFGLLLVGGCGGGGGGGGGGSSDTDSPTFAGATGVEAVSTSSDMISIKGGTGISSAVMVFEIRDAADVLVPDGRRVDFKIGIQPGGVTLSKEYAYTANGQVTVELRSGTTSGPVDIQARYYDEETGKWFTDAVRITIASGAADAAHLTLAINADKFSLNNSVIGDETTISAYLGDRYGNVVADGSPVSFITEGGTIGTSTGFDTTTDRGVAQANLRVTNPKSPDLAGPETLTKPGNPGISCVIAYTSGSESFADNNGDGVYGIYDEDTKEFDAAGDVFDETTDMSEPYLDENDNGKYDDNEKFIDLDGNNEFTDKNGVYNAQIMIWESIDVVFSDGLKLFLNKDTCEKYFKDKKYVDVGCADLLNANFTIGSSESKSFKFIISDSNGNTPPIGTEFEITTSYDKASITNINSESPITDLNGEYKTIGFSLETDKAEGGAITVRVVATLPNGIQQSGEFVGIVK